MNIANGLTILRFCLVPVFGYYIYQENYYTSIILFLLAGVTDVLDGYIARKYNMITSFGKFADPLADKLMQLTAIFFLMYHQLLPPIVVAIVVAKEMFMAIGSFILYNKKKFIFPSNRYGKLATVIFYFAIVAIIIVKIFKINSSYISVYTDIFVCIAVASTLYAFLTYLVQYKNIRKE